MHQSLHDSAPTAAAGKHAAAKDHPRTYSHEAASGFRSAWNDLVAGFRLSDVWRTFAWDEIQSRYRRSTLGLAWIGISYLLFVLGISLFFGGFSSKDTFGFVHYVALGYATFMYLVGNLAEGCSVFRSSASWIQSSSMPYSVYIYKGIARSLFPFAIQIGIALALMLLTGWRPALTALLAIPAIAVILFTAVGVQLTLGYLGARYNDLQHLIASIQRLLLFLTPILWVLEERTGLVRKLALFNPFTHYLEIFRAPLLGEAPMLLSVVVTVSVGCLFWFTGLLAASRMRSRLPFWI